MSDSKINPDDPRLSAYALGELSPEEMAEMAAAIEQDPTLAAEVEAIRAMGGDLASALGAEALPETEPVKWAEEVEFPSETATVTRFPYYWVSGLVAAGFAVLVMVQSPDAPIGGTQEFTVYSEPAPAPVESTGQVAPPPPAPSAAEAATPPSVSFPDPASAATRVRPVDEDSKVELSAFEVRAEEAKQLAPPPAVKPEPPLLSAENIVAGNIESDLGASEFDTSQFDSLLAESVEPERPQMMNQIVSDPSVSVTRTAPRAEEDVVELTPFTVSSVEQVGYASTATVSGKRVAKSPPMQLAASSNRLALPTAMSSLPEVASAEGYARQEEHGWKQVAHAPLSTFAVDVDSASYANVRRLLRSGQLPPVDAVKIEEMINAFPYDYAGPDTHAGTPLQANLEVAAAPWAPEHRLVRIGLKAREMNVAERAPANLVFLLDVSGSMNRPNKLPLVKEAMRLLVGQLRDEDRVAIVTYAGQSGLALPSTPVARSREIWQALDQLSPGGSTHGSSGIHLAYDVAKANFVTGGVNRVILCTDGDFNVGTTGLGELERLIAAKAESGVFLTALGFGTGNYQDDTLELLANRGNGSHGYIDSGREARRLLVEQVNGTLATVAQDVKIQVEFNPAQVSAYRLIGYNNRRLAAEDFNDDAVDAGEIGAGHTVTALYEVVPAGRPAPTASVGVDALRYQPAGVGLPQPGDHAHEMLTVKVRAQPPGGGKSTLHEFPLVDGGGSLDGATSDFKFAAAVAGFGLKLRALPAAERFDYEEVEAWARSGINSDPGSYRSEFLELVKQAHALSRGPQDAVR